MFRTVFLVALFTTVLIVILLFALKNGQPVPVDLVVTRLESVPLWAVMVVSFLMGIALTSLLFMFVFLGLYWSHRGTAKDLAKARAELAALSPASAPERDGRG